MKKKRKCTLLKIVRFQPPRQGAAPPPFSRQYSDGPSARLPTAALLESAPKQNKRKMKTMRKSRRYTTQFECGKQEKTLGTEWSFGTLGKLGHPRNKKHGTGGVRGEGKRSSLHLPSSLQPEGEREEGEGGLSARALSA
ncbi:unnamed protein product [Ixodes persulcatus]